MIVIFGKGRVGNSVLSLCNYLKIEAILMDDGDYDEKVLIKADTIIVSPGIPPFHKLYNEFKTKIQGELDFVYSIMNDDLKNNLNIVAVTGTDGKSTVCWMVYSLLRLVNDHYNLGGKVWLGGNFDAPFSEICESILANNLNNEKHYIAMEISSFMGFNIKNIQFDYSIWTNFQTDHLNWHNDMQDYFFSKSKVIENTKYHSYTNFEIIEKLNDISKVSPYEKVDLIGTKFHGEHNSFNLGASLLVVKGILIQNGIDISLSKLLELSKMITPLEHRIQLVKEIQGVKIYDDGKSTSANSLNAALNSFEDKVILIAGGSDKGDKFNHLSSSFVNKVAGAVLIGQTAQAFKDIFDELDIESTIELSMESAVKKAFSLAKSRKIKTILFSPGCASFGMFKNRLDRVQKFLHEVEQL
ncbi:MAG: Mur ligase family protein [Candidatus Absconditabacteria bacterium]